MSQPKDTVSPKWSRVLGLDDTTPEGLSQNYSALSGTTPDRVPFSFSPEHFKQLTPKGREVTSQSFIENLKTTQTSEKVMTN